MNLFEKLFVQYYQISNNKLNLSEKIDEMMRVAIETTEKIVIE